MAENVIREIYIPENNCTILVYRDGIAVLSPEESRVRAVWREKMTPNTMHHVLQWKRPSDADYLRAVGIPVTTGHSG
jgi:hypothetical protein